MQIRTMSLVAAACTLTACGFETGELDERASDSEALATESQQLANGPCKAAYNRLVRHKAIGDLGWLDVYYAPSLHRYCAVNMASAKTWGSLRGRSLFVDEGSNASRRQDVGRYRYYAGPIYVNKSAAGCLRLSAGIQATPTSDLGVGDSVRICD